MLINPLGPSSRVDCEVDTRRDKCIDLVREGVKSKIAQSREEALVGGEAVRSPQLNCPDSRAGIAL